MSESYQVNVIKASESVEGGKPIITVHLRYPRFIHSELMTHRVFSRNARSSRAVPVKTLLGEDIFLPHFMKNQPGMQAFQEFDLETLMEIEAKWIEFAKLTQEFSKWLADKGVHKQWANRPLEWFGWIDTLVTSTEWDNWFALRDHKDAAPEIHHLAFMMKHVFKKIEYDVLYPGEWHLPYIKSKDWDEVVFSDGFQKEIVYDVLKKISVARCARVSYAPFDGNGSIEKEIERYNLLRNSDPAHMSPFEHQAKLVSSDYDNPFYASYATLGYSRSNLAYPWHQYRKDVEAELNQ